jgi:RimJ/RimL family protein N-acetyltransferase
MGSVGRSKFTSSATSGRARAPSGILAAAVQIHTPRLTLRALHQTDLEAFVAYRSDPEVARWQGWDAPYPPDRAAALFAAASADLPPTPGQWRQVALARRSDDALLGDCAFRRSDDGHQAELGVTLARAHHGQGFAAEGLAALIDWLFDEVGLHRVFANCDPRNPGVIDLLRRVGMREEGRFVASLWWKESWVDELWFALLRHEPRPWRLTGDTTTARSPRGATAGRSP